MKAHEIIKATVVATTIVFLAASLYYSLELYLVRKYTVSMILPALQTSRFPLDASPLTPQQLNVLLKVEDPQFFQHKGVDFTTPGAGITTISQGLVKLLYFNKFKPGIAKLKQTLIAAYILDPLVSKEDQLRLFINSVYLGKGTHGFTQAADVYFHKSFADISEDEYLSIIAMIIAPDTFNIEDFPERNLERVNRIKKLISGEYKPHGLFDVYYGPLDKETQKKLPFFSYFTWYYK